MIDLISIKDKELEFVNLLKKRLETLEGIHDAHDFEIIVDGCSEEMILRHLLENKEIKYNETLNYIKKEIGYGNPLAAFEGGYGQAWQKPIVDRFPKNWEETFYLTKLNTSQLGEVLLPMMVE